MQPCPSVIKLPVEKHQIFWKKKKMNAEIKIESIQ